MKLYSYACFLFKEQSSKLFYLLRNDSERNECQAFFVHWNRRNSHGINQSFRLFRIPPNKFFSESGNPRLDGSHCLFDTIYFVVCRVPGLMTRRGAEMTTTPVLGVNPRKDPFYQRLWKVFRRQSKNLCVFEIPPVSFSSIWLQLFPTHAALKCFYIKCLTLCIL